MDAANVTSECPRPFSSLGGLLSGEGRGGKKERKPDFRRREREGGTRHERDEREREGERDMRAAVSAVTYLPSRTYLSGAAGFAPSWHRAIHSSTSIPHFMFRFFFKMAFNKG